MGTALRGDAQARGGWRRAAALVLAALALAALVLLASPLPAAAQTPGFPPASGALARLARGRFTIVADSGDLPLARALLDAAASRDTFPGLPRPAEAVLIAIAPDERRFRQWIGPGAPEWGAAIAFPTERWIVMQGSHASSDAGDPVQVLRHELAHLALHEAMGELPPRWFDEGYASYAAGEWGREEVLATSFALLLRGLPSLDSLDLAFYGGSVRAGAGYALAYRAVSDIAALDPERGLALFFRYWKESRSMDRAMREAYGVTGAEFERKWRQRTLRRYGALAFMADLTAALAIVGMLVLPLYVVRRRRDRRRLDALIAADEAAERAARESALEELLRSVSPPPQQPPAQ
ncbi:MAG TPA: hypothetical protein VFS05_12920 [Gemmatimonadaceae bacterium]|nr:hypothetical protein [Gemmatimonadaceae bacterium]